MKTLIGKWESGKVGGWERNAAPLKPHSPTFSPAHFLAAILLMLTIGQASAINWTNYPNTNALRMTDTLMLYSPASGTNHQILGTNLANSIALSQIEQTASYSQGTNVIIDANLGVRWKLWMTTNANLMITNWPTLPRVQPLEIVLVQTNGGSLALTAINSQFRVLTNGSINVTAAATGNDVLSLTSATNSSTAFAVIQKGFQ